MSFCGENKTYRPDYTDSLGPWADGRMSGPTGGPEARARIFDRLEERIYPRAQEDTDRAVAATNSAAADAGWGQIKNYASGVLGGKYLQANPYLKQALADSRTAAETGLANAREQATADMAGSQADTRSRFARSGMGFSTGQTQAQDTSEAALQAALARGEQDAQAQMNAGESQVLADNFARERDAQTQAAALLPAAIAAPSEMLSGNAEKEYGAIAPAAQIVTGMAGGGQVTPAQIARRPGVWDYMMQGAGVAAQASGGK